VTDVSRVEEVGRGFNVYIRTSPKCSRAHPKWVCERHGFEELSNPHLSLYQYLALPRCMLIPFTSSPIKLKKWTE